MNLMVQLKHILIRQLLRIVALSTLLLAASVVLSQVQASGLFVSYNQYRIRQPNEIEEKNQAHDPDVASPVNDQEVGPSDLPATTENNSTGDEILLRPPR